MKRKPTYYAVVICTPLTPTALWATGLTKSEARKQANSLTDSAPTRINGDPAEFGQVLTERQARKRFTW